MNAFSAEVLKVNKVIFIVVFYHSSLERMELCWKKIMPHISEHHSILT